MQKTKLKHVAIIMDGNRRWAQKHGLQIRDGHKEGVVALERIVKAAVESKVKHLTVYALSSENLKERSKSEIGDLFSIMKDGFLNKLPMLKKEGVRVHFLGEIEKLPLTVRKILEQAVKHLKEGKKLQLNVAINYGSRAEILTTIKKLENNKEINEKEFQTALFTKKIPDPELIIRTGGQMRLSNFLLWQAAYSELYFTPKLWPDFQKADFEKALEEYSKRKRNFGQ